MTRFKVTVNLKGGETEFTIPVRYYALIIDMMKKAEEHL